jgi:hypothetical protein
VAESGRVLIAFGMSAAGDVQLAEPQPLLESMGDLSGKITSHILDSCR